MRPSQLQDVELEIDSQDNNSNNNNDNKKQNGVQKNQNPGAFGIITQVQRNDKSKNQSPVKQLHNQRQQSQQQTGQQQQLQRKGSSRKSKSQFFWEYFCRCFIPKDTGDDSQTNIQNPSSSSTKNEYDVTEKRVNQLQLLQGEQTGKKLLILDLDETLVHSSFQPQKMQDFVVSIEVQKQQFTVYVNKRPGCEDFLIEMAKYYDVVIYTASLREYADPVIDRIDPKKVVKARLFRDSCTVYNSLFVKDLNLLGRDLKDIIIVDNSETSFLFQPENAIHIAAYFDDKSDIELYYFMPILQLLSKVYDVRVVNQWIELYEDKMDIIEYNDAQQMVKIFSKSQAFISFEELYPGRFLNHDEDSSEQIALTNRQRYTDQEDLQDPEQQFQQLGYFHAKSTLKHQNLVGTQKEMLNDEALSHKKQYQKTHKPKLTLQQSQIEEIYQNIQDNPQFKLYDEQYNAQKADDDDDDSNSNSDITSNNNLNSPTSLSNRKFISIKSKEYEDSLQKPVMRHSLLQENHKKQIQLQKHTSFIQIHDEKYERQKEIMFEEIRFQQNALNLNSPVAKEKIISFDATKHKKISQN